MSVDNVYNFTVQRQNSADLPPGKSPCVKIKFIKDESVPTVPKFKIGNESFQKDSKVNDANLFVDESISDYKVESSYPLSITNIHTNETSECLRRLLTQLHAVIQKRDTSGIFAVPVNEEHAPNYSAIISRPIDLRTIRSKIDSGIYKTVAQMFADVILMFHNALIYNDYHTVYHRIALQLLNFTKKSFSKDHLNKFVQTKLSWHRILTDEEIGDVNEGLHRITEILTARPKTRPSRTIHKNPHMDFMTKRRRGRPDSNSTPDPKRSRQQSAATDNVVSVKEESDIEDSVSFTIKDQSEGVMSSISSSASSSSESESDQGLAEEVLYTAQRAASVARARLGEGKTRPIVYFERRDNEVCVVNAVTGSHARVGGGLSEMVARLGSVDLEAQLSGCAGAQVQQLCYDSNECVTLTTSKPLEPYSCAEQAVLVETFGNVITAEYACNMHNYVLDLPDGSAAVELVKSRLNAATNYLTYGVDQIITKKLRAFRK